MSMRAQLSLFGPLMTLLFVFTQAMRDVYFSGVFQEFDLFEVILLAFPATTALFLCATAIRSPHQIARLRLQLRSLIGMNLATTLTWACYFVALKHVEPSIVNTLFGAISLLSAVVLIRANTDLVRNSQIRPFEYVFYLGLALTVILVWGIVLMGYSGIVVPLGASFVGLFLTMVSGVANTVSTIFERRMNERGVSPIAIVGTRFIVLSVFALIMELLDDTPSGIIVSDQPFTIIVAVIVLIILPTWIIQIAVAATSPITLKAIMALTPIIVFAFQDFDPRISYSNPTLLCIAVYAFLVIGANLSRGWRTDIAYK